jgi:hypothetical protein
MIRLPGSRRTSMRIRILAGLLLASLVAGNVAGAEPDAQATALLKGKYDNVAQTKADAGVPHVVVTIEPTAKPDWTLWAVHVETDPATSFDQTWAMQLRKEYDGSYALVPYYQLHQDSPPQASAFDPAGWLSLEACALRGSAAKGKLEGVSEGEPCVAVSMSVGARRALMPVQYLRQGDRLDVDLNLRGVRTRIEGRRAD